MMVMTIGVVMAVMGLMAPGKLIFIKGSSIE